jgi:hypothetical protein
LPEAVQIWVGRALSCNEFAPLRTKSLEYIFYFLGLQNITNRICQYFDSCNSLKPLISKDQPREASKTTLPRVIGALITFLANPKYIHF